MNDWLPKNCFSIYNAILPLPTMCSKVQIVLAIVCSMFSCPSSFTTKFPQIFTFATFSHRSFPPFRTSKHRTIRFHTRFPSFAVSNPSHEVVIQILDVDFPVVGIGTKGGHLPRLARCLTRVLWCPKTHHRRGGGGGGGGGGRPPSGWRFVGSDVDIHKSRPNGSAAQSGHSPSHSARGSAEYIQGHRCLSRFLDWSRPLRNRWYLKLPDEQGRQADIFRKA